MSAPIYVAGIGTITSIGNNVAENLYALEHGSAGMGQNTLLHSVHRHTLPVAEVKLTNDALSVQAGLPAILSRTALLSMLAAREALEDAGIAGMPGLRTGFISANSVGGMDKTENFYPAFLENKQAGKLRNVVHHECGSITEIVADKLGIGHFVTTISTACSSSANAIFFGARLLQQNMLDVVIAGGVDALTKLTLNGFNSLMILDNEFCKPFDENRKGLNLGEGAGYVVMVGPQLAKKLDKVYCRLSGYANANDAYHQTASSPDGTGSLLAMKGALQKAALAPADIDYINLHGTGTQNNDIAEGTAIKALFAPHYPKMSSTKSFTGHILGGCGGVEAVFSVLSVKHGLIYPNLRFTTQMKELPFTPETTFLKDRNIQHVMSNSFGFGGNCSSLIFSAV